MILKSNYKNGSAWIAPLISYGKEKKNASKSVIFFCRSGLKGKAAVHTEIHGFLYSSFSNVSAEGIPLLSVRVETKFYFLLHEDLVSRKG